MAEDFGGAVRRLRGARGWSLRELGRRAVASDVGGETVRLLESAVDELAMAYPVTPPAELLGRVRQPESIAEHSHRTALIASILAAMEGADAARAALLGTVHDSQETRIGDIPHNTRRYLTATPNEQVTADQVAGCPPAVAAMIADAVAEYESQATLEAQVARDADKLECLLQAIEYQRSGNRNVQP